MTVAPPLRRSRLVFWVAAIGILSAIVATALLANDGRNLHALAEHYHWRWDAPKAATAPMPAVAAADRAGRRGPRLAAAPQATAKPLPRQLVTDLRATPAAFLRRWKLSGETLCRRIAEAGIAVGPWHKGDFDSSASECSYETPAADGSPAQPASLFVIVRGTTAGAIENVRIKAILPDNTAGDAVKRTFVALLGVLVRDTQWGDLGDAVAQIGRLENVTQSSFGARLVFSHEFADQRRFNLILDLDQPSPAQSPTAAFFDASKWLPLPERSSVAPSGTMP